MFKQIIIILLLSIISYFVIKYILIIFHKLYLSEFIIKYKLTDSDKKYLKMHSNTTTIGNLLEGENLIFFTEKNWSVKNNNYIYDIKNDKYYIIDSGYYYYLQNLKDYKLTINNENLKIILFENKIKSNNNNV